MKALDLALTKAFVDLHGGAMTIESIPSTGTRITMAFRDRKHALTIHLIFA